MTRRALAGLSWLVAAAALLYAGYIPAKAWLAQRLLESAWQRQVDGQGPVPPWPWADTRPVLRLRQPRLAIDQIVLSGTSGRVLAFGPGHVVSSAGPYEPGNLVISGHRDTHFRWLEALRPGDELAIERVDGVVRRYRVSRLAVHHSSEGELLDPLAGDQLRLITCYPFDAVQAGTPYRFVVTAPVSTTGT